MLITALPMLTFALASVSGEQVTSPRAAQARLAEAIADADSVDWVHTSDHTITIAIDHAGEAFHLVATTRANRIVSLDVIDAGRAAAIEAGELTWLVGEMRDATAVTTFAVEDGHVTLVTSDGLRYAMAPVRGPNAAVEARWAGAWDSSGA